MNQDAELLKRYAEEDDQKAFASLVEKHLKLVYSAAYLRTGGCRDLAEDVSQRVFCDLARKSRALQRHPCLEGWLFTATRFMAIDVRKQRFRREKREALSGLVPDLNHTDDSVPWEKLRPLLESFLDHLKEADRTAVMLRFFENRSFAEIGERLGIGENAARMRVDRSIERLNTILRGKGLRSSNETLTAALSANAAAVPAIPLAELITRAAFGSGKASLIVATFLAMTKLKLLLLTGTATAVLAVGATAYVHAHQAPASPDSLTSPAEAHASLQPDQARNQQLLDELSRKITGLEEKVTPGINTDKAAAQAARDAYNKKYAVNTAVPYTNDGQATPLAAAMTFAWASVTGEVDILTKLIYFDGNGRAKAEAILARLPESVRKEYPTPEKLFALFLAADAKDYPPPPADLFRKATVVLLGSDRATFAGPDGTVSQGYQVIKTQEGWKYVFPEMGVEPFAQGKLSPKS